MSALSGISDFLYRNVFRRTSTFVLAIVGGGFMFERGFDKIGDTIYETRNKGVSSGKIAVYVYYSTCTM